MISGSSEAEEIGRQTLTMGLESRSLGLERVTGRQCEEVER